jgi:hypothetical protein
LSDVVEFLGTGGGVRHVIKHATPGVGLRDDVLPVDDSVDDEMFEFNSLDVGSRIVKV